jgi:class 3 adenylate cyclase
MKRRRLGGAASRYSEETDDEEAHDTVALEMTENSGDNNSRDTPLATDSAATIGDQVHFPAAALRFSAAVLTRDALVRRWWSMHYADPAVETEFLIFSHRSPWPLPVLATSSVALGVLFYLGPLRDIMMLAWITLYLCLWLVAILTTDTWRQFAPCKALIVSDRARALIIEHVVMPVAALTTVCLVLVTWRHPVAYAYHREFSWVATFSFSADNMTGVNPPSVADYLLDMGAIHILPLATTPRVLTAFPWLVVTVIGAGAVLFTTNKDVPLHVEVLYLSELIVKAVVVAVLLLGWEWDRRRHFEACVRNMRQSRDALRIVRRLQRHVDAVLPLGCPAPAKCVTDVRYASDDAAIVTVQLVEATPSDAFASGVNIDTTDEQSSLRQLRELNCLVDACDSAARTLRGARYSGCSGEIHMAFGLFHHDAIVKLDDNGDRVQGAAETCARGDTALHACVFATLVRRTFRSLHRRRFPDSLSEPPPLRIGIDAGAVAAVVPGGGGGGGAWLSALVAGRPAVGAATLATLAMPGTTLVSADVRTPADGHFNTTELHRSRIAGRVTSVAMLGQQFAPIISPPDGRRCSASMIADTTASESSGLISAFEMPLAIRDALPELQGTLVWNLRFADPDVELAYRAFETNESRARHSASVVAIILCVALAAAYFVTGSPMSAWQWLSWSLAVIVAICVGAVTYRGQMSQREQILVKLALNLLFKPFFILTAFFHADFFNPVRTHTATLVITLGMGMLGITPSAYPVVLDTTLRAVVLRLCERGMVGLTLGLQQTLVLIFSDVFTASGLIQLMRMRNREHFADVTAAERTHLTSAAVQIRVSQQLTRLMPAVIAQRFAQPRTDVTFEPSITFTPAAVVIAVTCVPSSEDTAGESVTPAGQKCPLPADSALLRELTVFQGIAEVASGAVTLQRHGERWLLFGDLNPAATPSSTEATMLHVAQEVRQRLIDALNDEAVDISVTLHIGPLAGGVMGATSSRTFVGVGSVVKAALNE